MKDSQSESAEVTKAHAAPVRSQVAYTHVQSKAVNKAKVETKLKEEATRDAGKESVLEYTNSDKGEREVEQEDYDYKSDKNR